MSTWKNRPSTLTIEVAREFDEELNLVNYITSEGRAVGSEICAELHEAEVVDWGTIILHIESSGHESPDSTFSGYDREENRKLVRAEIVRPDGFRKPFSNAAVLELAEFFIKEISPDPWFI